MCVCLRYSVQHRYYVRQYVPVKRIECVWLYVPAYNTCNGCFFYDRITVIKEREVNEHTMYSSLAYTHSSTDCERARDELHGSNLSSNCALLFAFDRAIVLLRYIHNLVLFYTKTQL